MKQLLIVLSMVTSVSFLSAMDNSITREYPECMSMTENETIVYFSTGRTENGGNITITPDMVKHTYVWTPIQSRIKTSQPLTLEKAYCFIEDGLADAIEFQFRDPLIVLSQRLRDSISTEGSGS